MTGPTNSTNKFGPASYIVGPFLGDGCNFTSIQAAYDQAVADGYGVGQPTTIYIRPGLYIEDLVLTNGGIALEGCQTVPAGTFSSTGAMISGDISCFITAINIFCFSNLTLTGNTLAAITVTGNPSPLNLSIQNCLIAGAAGFPAIDCQNVSGTFGNVQITLSTLTSDVIALNINSRTLATIISTRITGLTNAIHLDNTARVTFFESQATATVNDAIALNNAANQFTSINSIISAPGYAVDASGGGTVRIYSNVISSTHASGNFVTGTGTLYYANVLNNGSATGVDPAFGTINISDWKPYAEVGLAPGVGLARGTSCFNDLDFTVTDGFVSLVGSSSGPITQLTANDTTIATPAAGNLNLFGQAGCSTTAAGDTLFVQSVPFTEQPINFAAAVDSGYWVTAPSIATLPNAGLVDGTMVVIEADGAGVIIQADVAQTIRLSNVVSIAGGTATSTAAGDVLTLRYRSSTAQWITQSSTGNWTIV